MHATSGSKITSNSTASPQQRPASIRKLSISRFFSRLLGDFAGVLVLFLFIVFFVVFLIILFVVRRIGLGEFKHG
jgi:hypothetical protein